MGTLTRYRYTEGKEGGLACDLDTEEGVFVPTHTSQLLIQGVRPSIQRPGKLLDLGCGIGVCGLVLAKLGYCQLPIYLSDSSQRATEVADRNAQRLNIPAVIRQGSLFTPWAGEGFDVIVDDVSGVCEEVARFSPWFPEGVGCQTGPDGTALIVQVLEQAPRYLNPGGLLFFPVLSLSNEKRILETARSYFSEVSLITEQSWFLPEDLLRHVGKLEPLLKAGTIRMERRFGIWFWFTQIYKASLHDR